MPGIKFLSRDEGGELERAKERDGLQLHDRKCRMCDSKGT